MSVFSLASAPCVRSRAGLYAVSGGALLWGTTGVVVSILARHGGPSAISVGFYRLAISAVALGLLAPRRVGTIVAKLRARPVALLGAGAGLGAYQALYFIAVRDAGVSVATLISLGLAPVLLTTAEAVRQRHIPSRVTLGTVGAALAGLALVSRDTGAGPHPLAGLLAAIGSGLGYAGTTALNRRLAATGDPRVLTASASAVGALVLTPFALGTGAGFTVGALPLIGLGYLGVVATALAYWLFYGGLRTTGSGTAAVLTLLEPLAASVLAVVLLDEPMPATGVLGMVLLLLAVAALYVRPAEHPSG